MGSSKNCVCCHRNRHLILIVSSLFLLVSSLTFMGEARPISKPLEASQKGVVDEKMAVMRSMIGSRPPKCERMCSSCRNCEAIQVPVTTKAFGLLYNSRATHFSAIAYSRGDDITNYKPMSWKCKCGNLIFNP